jgi:hypothetical protein
LKQDLAESLLAKVMGWDNARMVEELPRLDRMARFKYDEYQQFGPGQKFLETLCLWLEQFKAREQREAAYTFVRDRLVFISSDEMRHLVGASFPDIIRPRLIAGAAAELGIEPYRLADVISDPAFRRTSRSTLYLGLSDGSRMDVFRRSAGCQRRREYASAAGVKMHHGRM